MRRPSRIQSKRISKTPSRSGPTNVFGTHDHGLEAAPAEGDGRAARPRSSTRRSARRRRADRPRGSGGGRGRRRRRSTRSRTTRRTPASSAAPSVTAVPSTLTERIAARVTWIGSAAAAWTSTSAPADEPSGVGGQRGRRRRAPRSGPRGPRRRAGRGRACGRRGRRRRADARDAGRGSRPRRRSPRAPPEGTRGPRVRAGRLRTRGRLGGLGAAVDRRRGAVHEDGRDEQDRHRDGALAEQAAADPPRRLAALEARPHERVVDPAPCERHGDERRA